MEIPTHPYVGLYGSHSGDWRSSAIERLSKAGITFYDPTDAAWSRIDETNGDRLQPEIDTLVAKQHLGLLSAACVVFHLARRKTRNGVTSDTDVTAALAARCELGFLTGRGIPTFVHIENDVEGRNYLWAQIALYGHMKRCDTLGEAVLASIGYVNAMSENGSNRSFPPGQHKT